MDSEKKHDSLTNQTLIIGMETKMLMKYIETGNINLYKAALIAKSARTIMSIYGS